MWERSDAGKTGYYIPLEKYEFACKHLKGKLVADAASGCGYGTKMLSKENKVIGFDISTEAINYAKENYGGAYIQCDISRQTFGGFDALVSIETLEHLLDPYIFLKNLEVPELVISTTVWDGSTVHDEWHKHNFTKEQFREMLQPKFQIIEEIEHKDGAEEYLTIYAKNLINKTTHVPGVVSHN